MYILSSRDILTYYLWVLKPHLQPLHSHESCLFVATCGCEKTEQISGHVVHGLPAVQLISEDIQHVVLHAFSQFFIPSVLWKKLRRFKIINNLLKFFVYGCSINLISFHTSASPDPRPQGWVSPLLSAVQSDCHLHQVLTGVGCSLEAKKVHYSSKLVMLS